MKYLVLTIALLLSVNLAAQNLTREAVAKDLHRMVVAMETYHCNAYHYTEASSIAALRDDLIANLPDLPTPMDAYRATNILACAFGDGHTRVWDYGVEKAYQENAGTYFPFAVDVIDDKLFIRHDYRSTSASLVGAEIKAINGVNSPTLIQEMSRHASRETADLDKVLLAGNFRRYLWLTYDWATESFTLTFSTGEKHVIPGMTAESIAQKHSAPASRPVVETRILNASTAYLRVAHFEGRPKTFKQRFRAAFAQINASGADRLILDLRGHDGGDSRVGDDLARYLTDQPFRQFAYSEWKATVELKENFKNLYLPGVLHWALPVLKGVNPHTKAIYTTPDGQLARVNYPMIKPYGKGKAFRGEVVLLIDNNTFSAGTCFAAMFKDYQMGLIVGQESGNLANFHADGLLRMSLLHRTLSFQISNSYLVRPNGDETPTPVQPDVILAPDTDALSYVLKQQSLKEEAPALAIKK